NWDRDFHCAESLLRSRLFRYKAVRCCVYKAALDTVSVHSPLACFVPFPNSRYSQPDVSCYSPFLAQLWQYIMCVSFEEGTLIGMSRVEEELVEAQIDILGSKLDM